MVTGEELTKHDAVLFSLVVMLQDAGMHQLGKLVHPLSGQPERDLDGARGTIEVLEMLQAKCRDGTPPSILRALDTAVMDLQMNWLDESRKAPAAPDAASDAGAASAADAPATEPAP